MSHNYRIIIVALSFFLFVGRAVNGQDSVRIGDSPPPLSIWKWLKGVPIKKFDKSQIYIVEFSATWCGFCRLSMPALSSVANRYRGRVTVMSVYVWEDGVNEPSGHYLKKVERYVRDMKNDISYEVAVDDPKQTMAKSWINASGGNGLPYALIIDKGKIIWIGNPIDLDLVLKEIFSGTFDISAATQQVKDANNLYSRVMDDVSTRNFDHAIFLTDSVTKANPMDTYMIPLKFEVLLRYREEQAYEYARQQLNLDLVEKVYAHICMVFVIQMTLIPEYPIKNPDWVTMFALCDKAEKISKSINTQAYCIDVRAKLYMAKGDWTKALETTNHGLLLIRTLPSEEITRWVLDFLNEDYKEITKHLKKEN